MKNPIKPVLTLMGGMSALAFVAASPLAHAAAPTSDRIWTPDSVTACKRLPLSEWGICKAEVVARASGSIPAAHRQYPASYTSAIAACDRLPLRQRGICRAGASMQGPQATASATPTAGTLTASNAVNARYSVALTACQALPRSERTTCDSDAELMRQYRG
ncbi:MAG TPA: hypothetical protein VLU54_04665 [Casimicrobiaceae bacterium]|nr:hypothetical protein [Casimicrobiaceae bacterium]